MGMPVVELEPAQEDLENYVEDAKSLLGGIEESLSESQLENELTEELAPWQDQEFHYVNHAIELLKNDEEVSSYQPRGGNPQTRGSHQYYIE